MTISITGQMKSVFGDPGYVLLLACREMRIPVNEFTTTVMVQMIYLFEESD